MNQRMMTTDEKTISSQSYALGEKSDCAVRAVALATHTDYTIVHAIMKANGRRSRCGTYMPTTEKSIRALGFDFRPVRTQGCSMRTIMRHLDPTRTYLVRISRHILCVRAGDVMDWSAGTAKRVKEVLEIIEQGPQLPATHVEPTRIKLYVPTKPRQEVSVKQWLLDNPTATWAQACEYVRSTGRSIRTLKIQSALIGHRWYR